MAEPIDNDNAAIGIVYTIWATQTHTKKSNKHVNQQQQAWGTDNYVNAQNSNAVAIKFSRRRELIIFCCKNVPGRWELVVRIQLALCEVVCEQNS